MAAWRKANAGLLCVALSGAVACGSSDGKTTGPAGASGASNDAGAPAYQSVCETEAKLVCSHVTVASCTAAEQSAETAAVQAGCTTERAAALSCKKEHPDTCNGAALIPDEACRAARDADARCLQGLTTGDPCAAPMDPCNQCECSTCHCDAACTTGQQAYNSCIDACRGSTTLQACLGACDGSTSPAFQAYVDCYANSCRDVCSSNGGGSGGAGP